MVNQLMLSLLIGVISAVLGSLFLGNVFNCEQYTSDDPAFKERANIVFEMCQQAQSSYITIYFIAALLIPLIVNMIWNKWPQTKEKKL